MIDIGVHVNLSFNITADDLIAGQLEAEQIVKKMVGERLSKWTIAVTPRPIKPTVLRIATFQPKEILDCAGNGKRVFVINDVHYTVRMNSDRYTLFAKSMACVACKIKGVIAAMELAPGAINPHFNFYALAADGSEVLMTKDHIKSVALGGSNRQDNYQTMCSVCNGLKGSDRMTVRQLRKLRKIYDEAALHSNRPARSHEVLAEKERIRSARHTHLDDLDEQANDENQNTKEASLSHEPASPDQGCALGASERADNGRPSVVTYS